MKRFLSLILAAVMVLSLAPMAAFVVSAATVSDEQGVVYDLSFDGTYYRVKSYTGTATDVVIPAEYEGLPVQEILDFAFYYSEIITSVVIGDSVTDIGSGAFAYCANLTSVVIGNSVTNIGDYAFAYSTNLTSVTIGSSVTSIGNQVFYCCENLTSIVIPESVTDTGYYVFAYCTNLTDIYCEAESQPESWNTGWIVDCDATVHWGYGKEEVLLGDLNNDDVVDSFDYSLVKRACFGTYELSDDELVSADVNGDGSIDSYDFLLIKRIVLGNYK